MQFKTLIIGLSSLGLSCIGVTLAVAQNPTQHFTLIGSQGINPSMSVGGDFPSVVPRPCQGPGSYCVDITAGPNTQGQNKAILTVSGPEFYCVGTANIPLLVDQQTKVISTPKVTYTLLMHPFQPTPQTCSYKTATAVVSGGSATGYTVKFTPHS